MASRIEISAEFPTGNSQREIHRFIAGLDGPATAFEQAIQEVTGLKVEVHIRSITVREKGEKIDKGLRAVAAE